MEWQLETDLIIWLDLVWRGRDARSLVEVLGILAASRFLLRHVKVVQLRGTTPPSYAWSPKAQPLAT